MRSCCLLIMDAGPLIKLALIDELDLLLAFDLKVYIPDEVYFEAAEKYAWERQAPLTPDKLRLKEWVKRHQPTGKVICAQTLVGEIASQKRRSGEYSPQARNHRKNTGELAAHDFFNHRESWGHPGEPALVLIDDQPGIEKLKLQALDVHILTTYSMLIALEEAGILASCEKTWNRIVTAIPTAPAGAHDESVRGDTEYKSRIKGVAP